MESEINGKTLEIELKRIETETSPPKSYPVPPTAPHNKLMIGSFIFRYLDENQLINTKVISKPGAKPADLTRILEAKHKDNEIYESVHILVGVTGSPKITHMNRCNQQPKKSRKKNS